MAVKLLLFPVLLFTLVACRESQRSLPVIQAAVSASQNAGHYKDDVPKPRQLSSRLLRSPSAILDEKAPGQPCYPFLLKRPRSQRAEAVQARLMQADRMNAAFDPDLLTVDLLGDHANILSVELPSVWPAEPFYIDRVSAVVEDYLSSADILDYLCNAGFAEVRLSTRRLSDGKTDPVWKAQVTSEGLVKTRDAGD
jgi:hypothetical protein